MKQDIVVVGGGFAGCFAAAKSALEGKKVTLVEQKSSLLSWYNDDAISKLLGNNSRRLRFQSKMFSNSKFVENSLKLFSPQKCALQLEGIGIHSIEIDDEYIYPRESCASVTGKMIKWLENCGINVLLDSCVTNIKCDNGSVSGVEISESDTSIEAAKVVIATGRDDKGVSLAETLGHISKPFHSFVAPIKLENDSPLFDFDRKSIPNIKLYLWSDGKKVSDARGEIIISNGTLMGTAPLTISPFITSSTEPSITLDLLPDIDEGAFDKGLINLCNEHGAETIQTILARNVIPRWLTETVCSIAEIDCNTKGSEFTGKQRKQLRGALYRFPIQFSGLVNDTTKVIDYSGGIQVDSINEESMESYVTSGVHFAGEMLDIDSQWGGFSIHLAISTGRLAGMCASGAVL